MSNKEPDKYEKRDISARVVLWFAGGLLASGIAIGLGILAMQHELLKVFPSTQRPTRVTEPAVNVPPPALQTNPARDLAEFRAGEERILTSSDWVDRNTGVIRIPVERAMDLLAQRGLPFSQEQKGEQKP